MLKKGNKISRSTSASGIALSEHIGDKIKTITDLFSKVKNGDEFEFIFFSKRGKFLPQEKYIELLKFFNSRVSSDKNLKLLEPEDTLDINYQKDPETNIRCTVHGEKITSLMKKVSLLKNHVVLKTLVDIWNRNKKESGLEMMKKEKKIEEVIDVDELDFRVRLSKESKLSNDEVKELLILNETNMSKIKFRYKQRTSLYVHGSQESDDFVRVDLTCTKMADSFKKLNQSIPNYELEIEYGTNKSSDPKILEIMMAETEKLLKIVQQSNYLISHPMALKVLSHYKNLFTINPETTVTALEARQAITLEVQHIPEEIPNKYAVTDKADGERHFLIICDNGVYFIDTNINIKNSGIVLPDSLSEYNGSVVDGELIFLPEKNRHLFLIFDCLFHKSVDVRGTRQLMKRVEFADDIVEHCFLFGKQKGFKIDKKGLTQDKFNLDKILLFHFEEMKNMIKVLNEDIEIEKKYPLIRRKYFIAATGAVNWEIFAYATTIWNAFVISSDVHCPYSLDGLIFQPLEQTYSSKKGESQSNDFKWKPPEKNSIDFYMEFEKDPTGKPLIVYDNSYDEFVRNKPYRICKLFVGQRNKNEEVPVLFREQQDMYWAYIFLNDGEVRDLDDNIISDKTVVEFYYNSDPSVMKRFRWVPIRTRYDKTESVLRFGRKYGNYITTADKVWRSIINPVIMADFDDLAKGNNSEKNMYAYDKKITLLKSRISHELIISTAKENAYFQLKTNLAKPMRDFNRWIESNQIYTYCHPMYQNNKQLSILDIGCGRGASIPKFYYVLAAFCVGLDIDREGLVSAVDGAISRYNHMRKKKANFPKMYFIQADCGAELDIDAQRSALNTKHIENEGLFLKFFGREKTLFDRINCQFAIHYFFKSEDTLKNFKTNVNNHLRNGGYLLATTFDGRKVMELLGDKERFVQEYTDENGKSKTLFEIIKKYDVKLEKNTIVGTGHAIDIYLPWISLEGRFVTEYLVDSEFMTREFDKDCDLELIDTDTFDNQLKIHEKYLTEYSKYEDVEETRNYLTRVGGFYKQTSINLACQVLNTLYRHYTFRKRDSGKTKQKGGDDPDNIIDFSDSSKFMVPQMTGYNNDFSCTNAIHHIMRSHKVIPKTISPVRFCSDLGIGFIKDSEIDKKLSRVAKDIIIHHSVNKDSGHEEIKTVIDGINIFVVERDCNDAYDIDLVQKSKKISSKDSAIILMKEGAWYVPVYYLDPESSKRIGIFNMDHPIIKKMMDEL